MPTRRQARADGRRHVVSSLAPKRGDRAAPAARHLAAEARAAASFYGALSEERGMSIAVRGAASVNADREFIERVLSNLLGNAIRHGAANRPVSIDIAQERDAVTLVVRNAGPAIPTERLSRLFDRFYTGDPARAADAGGSGPGTCDREIDRHAPWRAGRRRERRARTSFTSTLPIGAANQPETT